MSLRCSLLGHEYEGSEIEREREERGNEVVITVVELERCTHCSKTRTISENTEVTQLSRSESTSSEGVDSTAEPDAPSNADSGASRSGSGIRPRPDAGSESGSGFDSEAGFGAESGTESAAEFGADPASEDAEIIEDEADDGGDDRDPTDWPEVDDHEGREGSADAWPSVEGEDEGFDAATPDGPTDVEFGGLTPQADRGAEIIESGTGGEDPAFVGAESTPTSNRPADSGSETALYCPHCETAELTDRDSLRAGDICPACHRGYLAERDS